MSSHAVHSTEEHRKRPATTRRGRVWADQWPGILSIFEDCLHDSTSPLFGPHGQCCLREFSNPLLHMTVWMFERKGYSHLLDSEVMRYHVSSVLSSE